MVGQQMAELEQQQRGMVVTGEMVVTPREVTLRTDHNPEEAAAVRGMEAAAAAADTASFALPTMRHRRTTAE